MYVSKYETLIVWMTALWKWIIKLFVEKSISVSMQV